ncbi:hypothetical protein C8R45DRAFT_1090621 [Mycena sanguinolenta]|nr:hypothetical protein C8R45DRAFT_1090621 [Mycena sanguinolenta]
MPTTLIVGATCGLGAALNLAYAQAGHAVYKWDGAEVQQSGPLARPPPAPGVASLTCIVDFRGFGLNLVNDVGSPMS